MNDDPKDREDAPQSGMPDDLNEIDRAMLAAIFHRQRDTTPLSLDQESLLDSWIAGRLPAKDADRAAELAKFNKLAAERVLERRLIAVANEGPDIPSALSAQILRASRPWHGKIAASERTVLSPSAYVERPGAPTPLSERILRVSGPPRSGPGGLFNLRWPMLSAWQWSGLGAAAAAIAVIAVFGFQVWQVQLRSDQSFQIAMVTIEDRSVLLEGSGYRTRGRRQEPLTPNAASRQQPGDGHFRDMEVPTTLLRRAINGASTDKGELEYSELMSYLHTQSESFDRQSRIVIDSALADIVFKNEPEPTSTQIRAYNLDDPLAATIRSKIGTLPANAKAILLASRP
jgi:hypothetical protein